MQFKLALFALSSLAAFVAANPLQTRKASLSCDALETLQCCTLRDIGSDDDANAQLAQEGISAAGLSTRLVGFQCGPARFADDEDDTCNDNNDIACCPFLQFNPNVHVNCRKATY